VEFISAFSSSKRFSDEIDPSPTGNAAPKVKVFLLLRLRAFHCFQPLFRQPEWGASGLPDIILPPFLSVFFSLLVIESFSPFGAAAFFFSFPTSFAFVIEAWRHPLKLLFFQALAISSSASVSLFEAEDADPPAPRFPGSPWSHGG